MKKWDIKCFPNNQPEIFIGCVFSKTRKQALRLAREYYGVYLSKNKDIIIHIDKKWTPLGGLLLTVRDYNLKVKEHTKIESNFEYRIVNTLSNFYPTAKKEDLYNWVLDLRIYKLSKLLSRLDKIYKRSH